jgi:hypothetical protein
MVSLARFARGIGSAGASLYQLGPGGLTYQLAALAYEFGSAYGHFGF